MKSKSPYYRLSNIQQQWNLFMLFVLYIHIHITSIKDHFHIHPRIRQFHRWFKPRNSAAEEERLVEKSIVNGYAILIERRSRNVCVLLSDQTFSSSYDTTMHGRTRFHPADTDTSCPYVWRYFEFRGPDYQCAIVTTPNAPHHARQLLWPPRIGNACRGILFKWTMSLAKSLEKKTNWNSFDRTCNTLVLHPHVRRHSRTPE